MGEFITWTRLNPARPNLPAAEGLLLQLIPFSFPLSARFEHIHGIIVDSVPKRTLNLRVQGLARS